MASEPALLGHCGGNQWTNQRRIQTQVRCPLVGGKSSRGLRRYLGRYLGSLVVAFLSQLGMLRISDFFVSLDAYLNRVVTY